MRNKKKYVSGKFQVVSLIPSIELIYVIWYLIDHCEFFLEIFLQNMQKTKKKKRKTKKENPTLSKQVEAPNPIKKETVCSCHAAYAFQSQFKLYSCLNVKNSLLAAGIKFCVCFEQEVS